MIFSCKIDTLNSFFFLFGICSAHTKYIIIVCRLALQYDCKLVGSAAEHSTVYNLFTILRLDHLIFHLVVQSSC